MTNELLITDGKITVRQNDRMAFTTDGTLINLLPATSDLNLTDIDVTFPQFATSDCYYWSGQYVGGVRTEGCQTAITAIPQEWNNFGSPVVLGAVPSGLVDFLDVLVWPRRINTPSTWMGQAIAQPVTPPSGGWIDGSGSMLIESALGMQRSASVVIQDGNVVLLMQQSVSAAPGGYTNNPAQNQGRTHGANGAGLPVFNRDQRDPYLGGDPYLQFVYRRDGLAPCATNNITNYASNWRFDFRIAFGRRS